MAPTSPSRYQNAVRDAQREVLRTTLLDSARDLLRSRRWTEITMAEIATGAEVSRQTLYNEFGSRAEFVQAYLLHDADRILTAVEQAIAANTTDPRVTIQRAFLVFLQTVVNDPLAITVLAGDDPDGLLSLVTTRGGPVLNIAAARLGGAISRNWPTADAQDVGELADTLVRLALSYTMLPAEPADLERSAELVANMLTPFAERALNTDGLPGPLRATIVGKASAPPLPENRRFPTQPSRRD